MIPDIAVLWAIIAHALLAVGVVVFMFKYGYLEDGTHLDKTIKQMKGEG